MLLSDVKYNYVKGMITSLDKSAEGKIEQLFNSMTRDALEKLDSREIDRSKASILRTLDLRYAGQGYELDIAAPTPFDYADTVNRFEAKHEAVYGYKHLGERIEVTAVRLTVVSPARKAKLGTPLRSDAKPQSALLSHRRTWFSGNWFDTPVYSRELLPQNEPVIGPEIVEEYDSTIAVPPQWKCESSNTGCLILRRIGS